MLYEAIAWKGIRDYLSAARTLVEHRSRSVLGPRMHCQGLAVELALKFCLHNRDGKYPKTHDLVQLATECAASVQWTDEELKTIRLLNEQYLGDGDAHYPARYRPTGGMRVVISPGPEHVEQVVTKVVSASRPKLLKSILPRGS